MRFAVVTAVCASCMLSLVRPARSQDIDLGGSVERTESLADRRDAYTRAVTELRVAKTNRVAFVQAPPTKLATYFKITPSFDATDSAIKYGTGAAFVLDTAPINDGIGTTVFRPSYKASRPAGGSSHRNVYGIGLDVQLTPAHTDAGLFVVSADYGVVKDKATSSSVGAEYDVPVFDGGIVFANIAYARTVPKDQPAQHDIVPTAGLNYTTPTTTAVTFIVQYTFRNDVDGEDGFSIKLRKKLLGDAVVLFSIGKHGRFIASYTQTLKKAG